MEELEGENQKASSICSCILPGLVDLQVNGYKGVDFSGGDLTEESFAQACRDMLAAGATAFLPTLITSPGEIYERNLPMIAKVLNAGEFRGRVLGIHLEGPFISRQDGARGAHDARWVRDPDPAYLDELIRLADGKIRLLTIAADQKGADELSRHAISRGIAVSLGHHMADEADLARLVAGGAKALTHLGNAVPALLPRHENPIWAGLTADRLDAMIIADGHHLPPSILKTILRAKGAGHCIVVSDASPLAGFPPGEYWSMGARVCLEADGKLHNPATGYMAGSSATILDCANHLASLGLVGLSELGQMFFYNPLRLIGLSPKQVVVSQKVLFDVKHRRVFLE
ncbi:MAG TPA: amidohydrolase family protein [Sedimentisphaerales bacterium]|nr:amidohydrolase family protein [Sedimentisphaerales bacterium]HQI27174.1 amidohydrolase family protein [Sedimentisphaerales bacterium]